MSTTDTSMMTAVPLWTLSLLSTRGALEEKNEGEAKCTWRLLEDKCIFVLMHDHVLYQNILLNDNEKKCCVLVEIFKKNNLNHDFTLQRIIKSLLVLYSKKFIH